MSERVLYNLILVSSINACWCCTQTFPFDALSLLANHRSDQLFVFVIFLFYLCLLRDNVFTQLFLQCFIKKLKKQKKKKKNFFLQCNRLILMLISIYFSMITFFLFEILTFKNTPSLNYLFILYNMWGSFD